MTVYVPWTGDTTALILRPCAALTVPGCTALVHVPRKAVKLDTPDRMLWWIPTTGANEITIDAGTFPKAPKSLKDVPVKDRIQLAGEVATAILAGDSDGVELFEVPTADYPHAGPRARIMIDDPSWKALQGACRGALDFAQHATATITDKLLEPPEGDGGSGGGGGGGGDGDGDGEDADGDGGGGDGDGVADLLEAVAKEVKHLDELAKALEALAPGFLQASAGTDSSEQTFGAKNEPRLKLAERILKNPSLRRVLDLAGRIASSAWQQRQEPSPNARDEVSDVTRGDDLTRALPYQFMMLAEPTLQALALKDWVDKGLLQYEMTGKEPVKRGPIVVAIDTSGSMVLPVVGVRGMKRIDVAAAVAIGCIRTAHAQKRDVYLCGFDFNLIWTAEVKKTARPDDVAKVVLQVASLSPCSGTSFDPPVEFALKKIATGIPADLVVVTDGEGSIAADVGQKLARARKGGLFVFALTIDGAGLGLPADRVIPVDSRAGAIEFGEELGRRPTGRKKTAKQKR